MLRCIALCAGLATLSNAVVASAQIDPDDDGMGTKLGLMQRNNSGQVGTVTLLDKHGERTVVVVAVFSEPYARVEPARIVRARACDTAESEPAYRLAPLVHGTSRTLVPLPAARLLSGNYIVDVRARDGSGGRVSCGELHR